MLIWKLAVLTKITDSVVGATKFYYVDAAVDVVKTRFIPGGKYEECT